VEKGYTLGKSLKTWGCSQVKAKLKTMKIVRNSKKGSIYVVGPPTKAKKAPAKKPVKKNPFTGKAVPKKHKPVTIRVSMKAKNSAAFKTLSAFLAKMMSDGAKAKGSKGLYECRDPAKRKIVYYEDWESHHAAKAFTKAMRPNIKTLARTVLKGHHTVVKVSHVPSKAYYCRVWAPVTKGKISSTRKNAAVLKAFSTMVVDKVLDSKTVSNGPIGGLIIKMARKVKMTPEIQYAYAIAQLQTKFTGGVTKYVLDHIAKAMAGKNGLLVVGPVTGKLGNWVHMNAEALGLSGHSFQLVAALAAHPGRFTMTLAKIDKAAVGSRLKRYYKHKAEMTVKDYHSLFSGKCLGTGCLMKGKTACKASKYCKWSTGWDGN